MRSKGFTLIELLAVIVILAIIALIATPIILNIINDAKEETNQRSVELYADAIRNAVAQYQLKENKKPTTYIEIEKYVEYDGDIVCETKKLYDNGSVYLDGCKVNNSDKEYTYGKACSLAEDFDNNSIASTGDIIECILQDSVDKFYVVSNDGNNIQMLTEYNLDTTTSRQSIEFDVVNFSKVNYWSSIVTNYPTYVYGDYKDQDVQQNLIYPIVEKYVLYIKEKVSTATAKLLSYEQALNLQCDESLYSCINAPNWVKTTNYWLGTASNNNSLWYISNNKFEYRNCGFNCNFGVRPVIIISKSNI